VQIATTIQMNVASQQNTFRQPLLAMHAIKQARGCRLQGLIIRALPAVALLVMMALRQKASHQAISRQMLHAKAAIVLPDRSGAQLVLTIKA
jgi:hypothetical protein